MARIISIDVPSASLLAGFGPSTAYRDCFACTVHEDISLPRFVERFYTSTIFRPERLILSLIGRGATNQDAHNLALGESRTFAAWELVDRRESEILLRDFSGATASWLAVEPASASHTRLMFGSWVGKPDRAIVRALMPLHRVYSRALLSSAS